MSHQKNLEVPNLRRRLVVLDCVALLLAWLPMLTWKLYRGMEVWKLLVVEAVLLASGLALLALQGLYLARVASSRVEEMRRIVRSAFVLGFLQAGLLHAMSVELQLRWLIAGPLVSVVLLLWFRGGYRAWLSTARAAGRHLRDVIVIGVNADAADLVDMLADHPEAGFRVRGVVGDPTLAVVHGLSALHLGTVDDLLPVLRQNDVRGVITVVGALPARELRPLIFELEEAGIHIQVSNGLHGMAHRRLRATPVAYQSLYYLEPPDTGSPQLVVKRWLDVGLALFTLVFALPIMAVLAVIIKVSDRGPVLFRQKRVGKGGELFNMLKFRSMVPDAEARLAALSSDNERVGPLFKLERDPRVTRIGRVHPGHVARRAAAVVQRVARSDERGRPSPRAALRGRPVRQPSARPFADAARHHRPVAGGSTRQPALRCVPPPRPVLRRQLVAQPRPRHPGGHHRTGAVEGGP